MNISTSRLNEEHIANVFNNLKQLDFLVVIEHRKFINHFNVLSVMHYLRQLFVVKFNEQIDLTFNFAAHKIFNDADIINVALI